LPKVWKDDFNTKIIGEGRHWAEHPPGSPHEIHHQWRISLNENLLINIFENPNPTTTPPAKTDNLTFNEYYNLLVKDFVKAFIGRLEDVPTYNKNDEEDGAPQDERSRFKEEKVKRAQRELGKALKRASEKDAEKLKMKDLYLKESYDDLEKKAAIDEISNHFRSTQEVLRWVCMPFLQFSRASGPMPRPDENDLTTHLTGKMNGEQKYFSISSLTYRKLIFLETKSAEDREKYKATREFAFTKGFFVRQNVFIYYYKHICKDIKKELGPDGAAAIAALSDKEVKGGGNGYKCHYNPTTGQKSCIPGAPADYCANGGQTCTR
jgi:hypothetical protein